jgi:hypothetical protein
MVKTWVKPCIEYGACPFDKLDSSKEVDDSFCKVYEYECPSYSFIKKIRGGESDEPGMKSCLALKGDELLMQMDNGIEEIEKCTKVRELYKGALREELESGTVEYGVALYKQGITSLILANNGVDAKNNCLNAIEFCRRARSEGLVDGSVKYAESLVSEARAHYLLVEHGEDAQTNYETAVQLFQQARTHGFKMGTHEYASTMVDEADTLLQLSRLGVESKKNLDKMRELLSKAQSNGLSTNSFHNIVLTSLEEHLETALNLH